MGQKKIIQKNIVAVLVLILMIAIPIGVGMIAEAVTGSNAAVYTTEDGEWVQVNANTWTMDTDGDDEANITLVKDGDEWKYYFEVEDDSAEYYAWENLVPEGYEVESDYEGYYPDGSGEMKEGYYTITTKKNPGVITNKTKEELMSYGGIELTKKVTGSSADAVDKNFRFNITLSYDADDSDTEGSENDGSNGDISTDDLSKFLEGTQVFGDVTFRDGVGLVYLKNGETVSISDVPAGIKWQIEEVDCEGYTVTWQVDGEDADKGSAPEGMVEGTVEADKTAAVVCTNTDEPDEPGPEPETGNLSVKKTVENGDANDEFTFHSVFWGLEPGSSYSYYPENGAAGVTEYSHTSNIDDDGNKINNQTYPHNAAYNDVVSIPGAKSLHVSITYNIESISYDWVCMWAGSHPEYSTATIAGNNVGSSITGKLGSNSSSFKTAEYDVDGDSVTFFFKSDGSVAYYGYYAVITASRIDTEFTANAAGMADVAFTLKGGESITFEGLPVGCQYQVIEESSDYTASYKIEGAVTAVSEKGENYASDQSLTTAKEKLDSGESATVHFTNRKPHVDEDVLTIPVQKIWNDNNNEAGLRPDSITVYLLQNGDVIGTAILDEASEWQAVFDNLERYQNDGETPYEYSIQEVKVPGYETNITQNDDGSYTITNNSEASGHLKVSKSVVGGETDSEKEFRFTVSLTDSDGHPVTGTFALDSTQGTKTGTIVFNEDGKTSFTLKDQESIVISNLPSGTQYTVKETSYSGYVASKDGVYDGTIDTNQTAEVVITNTRCYDLMVIKTVAGSMGDKTKEFRFQLQLSGDAVPETLTYIKGGEKETVTLNSDQTAEFTLAHDESVVFAEIPYGVAYKVTEIDGKSSGYDVAVKNGTGTITTDTVVEVTNTKNGTIPTGIHANTFLVMGIAVVAAFAIFMICRKRKRNNCI